VKQFPGLIDYDTYNGPFACLALVILEKQVIASG
jgi:hypothetical protein